ncbi:MAG: 3-dehydroquinate synthase [Bacteroidota bacterium]
MIPKKTTIRFSTAATNFYFDAPFSDLKNIVDQRQTILITDENLFGLHEKKFKGWKTIVIKAGEAHKNQANIDNIIQQLIDLEADRKTTLVGIGGGVVTDMTGYVAAIYMRGLSFGFIPTTILAMVDASIGGKNGIDVGLYKNMVGVIRQPSFLLYDVAFLKTLPDHEWINGFAEIIKHACIKDSSMFKQLQSHDIAYYQRKKKDLQLLIQRNAKLKAKVVQFDEFEKGDRKLLNYGHTMGHALENLYELSHGQAISIGMVYAAHLSQQLAGFKQVLPVITLLEQYGLPTHISFDAALVFTVLKMDKKREFDTMNFVLLEKTGRAVVKPIQLQLLKSILENA